MLSGFLVGRRGQYHIRHFSELAKRPFRYGRSLEYKAVDCIAEALNLRLIDIRKCLRISEWRPHRRNLEYRACQRSFGEWTQAFLVR